MSYTVPVMSYTLAGAQRRFSHLVFSQPDNFNELSAGFSTDDNYT